MRLPWSFLLLLASERPRNMPNSTGFSRERYPLHSPVWWYKGEVDQPGSEQEWSWSQQFFLRATQEPGAFSKAQFAPPNQSKNQDVPETTRFQFPPDALE